MKSEELFEDREERRYLIAAKRRGSSTIETDTGTATLHPDGSMRVNNSGYTQELTPKMVQQAWSRAKFLDVHPDIIEDMKMDYEGVELEQEIEEMRPFWTGEFYDFGEEAHTIPDREEFEV